MEDSMQYSDITWDEFQLLSMKARIEELVNKVTIHNIQEIAQELQNENLIAGRGLFCQAIMKSQMEAPWLTNVYASLATIINSEFPDVGLFLVKRVALQFKEAASAVKGKKNKKNLQDISKFVAHLVNQRVVFEYLALDVILTLLMNPNSDNLEIAVKFCVESGSSLQVYMPDKLNEVFEEFGRVLRMGVVKKRVQLMIVRLFAIRKSKFKRYPGIVDGLDFVEVGDQITHHVSLLHDIDPENSLDDLKQEGQFDDDEVSSQVAL